MNRSEVFQLIQRTLSMLSQSTSALSLAVHVYDANTQTWKIKEERKDVEEVEEVEEGNESRRRLPALQDKMVAIVDVGFSNKDFLSAAISAGGGHAIADEIWAIDEMAGVLMHHRAFSMRPLESRRAWDWLKEHPGPIYCSIEEGREDEEAPFPGCFGYPLRQALEVIGVPYLTSSAAYALAYAIVRGVKTIKLYGIDAPEVRPCIEYLICKALHRGISVQIGASSSLMDSSAKAEDKLYGFCEREDPPVPTVVDNQLTVIRRSDLH